MIKLRRRAKLNRNSIPPLQPAYNGCFNLRGGVKPFVHAVFKPFSLSEWEIKIGKWEIKIVLSRGVALVMLNLFQHLANMKEELLAKKTFTPKHLVSLACNLFTNKILNQVQDDITKNPRKNIPLLNTSEKAGDKKCLA